MHIEFTKSIQGIGIFNFLHLPISNRILAILTKNLIVLLYRSYMIFTCIPLLVISVYCVFSRICLNRQVALLINSFFIG